MVLSKRRTDNNLIQKLRVRWLWCGEAAELSRCCCGIREKFAAKVGSFYTRGGVK